MRGSLQLSVELHVDSNQAHVGSEVEALITTSDLIEKSILLLFGTFWLIHVGTVLTSVSILFLAISFVLTQVQAAITVRIACLKVGSNASNLGSSELRFGHESLHLSFTSSFDLRGGIVFPVFEAVGGILLEPLFVVSRQLHSRKVHGACVSLRSIF